MRIGLFKIVIVVLFAGSAQAEIYTCKNAKGETIYTDSPSQCVNAEEVKVDKLPSLTPSKSIVVPLTSQSDKVDEEGSTYSVLIITSPKNDAVINDNKGAVTINFQSKPALQTRKGHKYVISIDGKEVYQGSSTITALKDVDRGSHTISAKVIASDGSTKISAKPVSFTFNQFSELKNTETNTADVRAGEGIVNDFDDVDPNDNSDRVISNQKFPNNTKFNRPATPPPASN
ncbi:MAG: DUF4124 domain-containing protein [Pseudomonadota bacterium]